MNSIDIIGILTWVVTVVNLVFAVVVLFNNPKKSTNISYAFVIVSLALWSIATYFYNNPILFSPYIWLQIVYILSYLMLFSQAVFVYFFPTKSKRIFWLFFLPVVLSIIPSAFELLYTQNVIREVIHYPDRFLSVASMGSSYFIYTIPNFGALAFLSIYFFRKSRRYIGFEKSQMTWYIIGALAMMIPIVIIDYLFPMLFNSTEYYRLGPLFVIPFTLTVAYSMLKNRFLGIKYVFGEILIFLCFALLNTVGFFLFALVFESLFGSVFAPNSFLLSVITAPFYTYLFLKFQVKVRNTVRKYFIYSDVNPEELLNLFVKRISTELDNEKISVYTMNAIEKYLRINEIGILLFNKENTQILFRKLKGFDFNGSRDLLQVVHYWSEINEDPIMVYEELRLQKERYTKKRLGRVIKFMEQHKIAAILPLNRKVQLNGVVVIGFREDYRPITVEEINFLESIIANTSVAMGRALLYSEVQKFNHRLKDEVDDATKALNEKVLALEEARKKERDMMDILGHELRTPLSIIKLSLDILNGKVKADIRDKVFVKDYHKYSKRLADALSREIELLERMISSTKIDAGRIDFHLKKLDMKDLIETSILAQRQNAAKKDLKLSFDAPAESLFAYADEVRVGEVLDNIIGNAVKYTEKGSVTISAKKWRKFIKVIVEDTGVGIPESALNKLGNKFFRVEQYTNGDTKLVRPGGSGLGLYVSFGLIKLMGGNYEVKSTVGKGSTFIMTFPLYEDQVDNFTGTGNVKNVFVRMGFTQSDS